MNKNVVVKDIESIATILDSMFGGIERSSKITNILGDLTCDPDLMLDCEYLNYRLNSCKTWLAMHKEHGVNHLDTYIIYLEENIEELKRANGYVPQKNPLN